MSLPRLGRASRPPGRSSVPQSRVHHFTVITLLLVATVVASSQPKDECQQDSANFASQIHTMGSIDDALWAITKPDWNVYKLTPCGPGSDSLVHCMKVDSPIAVDTKWPKLAESVKSAAKEKDFTFTVGSSFIMASLAFGHTILAMHSESFIKTYYFGFDFGKNNAVTTGAMFVEVYKDFWISSDEKDKAYRLFNSSTKMENIFFLNPNDGTLLIKPNGTQKNICSTGSKDALQIRFQDGDCTGSPMDWSVKKGVLYHKQYYLFESTKVYIFSEQAESDYTKLQTVSLTDFFQCYKPSTMTPPSTSPNVTYPQISTNSTHMSTTAKGSSTTIIIIVVVVIGLVVIVALGLAYFCWCRTKASKDGKSGGNIKLASSSSPNDSKVSAKARNVSKGSLKQSQTKGKTVARNGSQGKQAK